MIDVSSHNGIIDWQRVKAAGVSGAYIRATMGLTGVDTRFHDNAQEALAEGLQVGFYALLRPEYTGKAQADHFLSVVDEIAYNLPHAVDVELDGLNALQVRSFLSRVEEVSGSRAAVYTSATHWVQTDAADDTYFAHFPLWVAMYNPTASEPDLPRSWTTWFLWQYTSSGTVDGINRRVDLNRRPPAAPAARFELYTPFQRNVVTSYFNAPRDYSFAPHRLQLHEGEDSVDGDGGLTVYCGRAGKVVKIGYDARGYGNYAIIDFGGGWQAWYAHFASIRVKQGQNVSSKQPLGIAGSTGSSTGIHMHITLTNPAFGLDGYVVAKCLDPAPYLVEWE